MASIEIVERDVELVDAGTPEGGGALRREHAAMRDERDVLEAHGRAHGRDDVFEIATQEWFAARERDKHGIEVSCRIRVRRELVRPRIGRRFPVVAEAAPRIAAECDLEVHEQRALPQREPRVLRQKERNMPGFEPRREH